MRNNAKEKGVIAFCEKRNNAFSKGVHKTYPCSTFTNINTTNTAHTKNSKFDYISSEVLHI